MKTMKFYNRGERVVLKRPLVNKLEGANGTVTGVNGGSVPHYQVTFADGVVYTNLTADDIEREGDNGVAPICTKCHGNHYVKVEQAVYLKCGECCT